MPKIKSWLKSHGKSDNSSEASSAPMIEEDSSQINASKTDSDIPPPLSAIQKKPGFRNIPKSETVIALSSITEGEASTTSSLYQIRRASSSQTVQTEFPHSFSSATVNLLMKISPSQRNLCSIGRCPKLGNNSNG